MEDSLNALANLSGLNPLLLILVIVWTLIWKGFALWRAAELKQKYWFIAILLINTLGILEIIYLFLITKDYKVEVIEEKQ